VKSTQLFIVFAVLSVLLLTPDMMCLIPGVQMTVDEHECCLRMGADCGKVPMPASHLCCSKVETQGPSLASGKTIVNPPVQDVTEATSLVLTLSDFIETARRLDTGPPIASVSPPLNVLRI
jgi:hypothetical protein